MSKLVIVTGCSNVLRAESWMHSWQHMAKGTVPIVIVRNGQDKVQMPPQRVKHVVEVRCSDYMGSVPAFSLGVREAMRVFPDVEIIACLHDDLEIRHYGWDELVLDHFRSHPNTGLAGFFGASGLGDSDLYQKPYSPWQLARNGCRSAMADAEAHGARSETPARVACLDGFSLIGRTTFFQGVPRGARSHGSALPIKPVWNQLEELGLVHHIYDGAMGLLAARYGWETYFLPVSCHHYGGQTAVGDAGYNEWAQKKVEGGDQGFWNEGHKLVYDEFRDILPLRVE